MFLVLGLILLATSFFGQQSAFEIQLYDTYYLISWYYVFGSLGVLCCLIEAAYYLLACKGVSPPGIHKRIHIIGSFISVGLLYYSQVNLLALRGLSRRYFSFSDYEMTRNAYLLSAISILLFVIMQTFFLLTLLIRFLRKDKVS